MKTAGKWKIPKKIWMSRRMIFRQLQRSAVTEKGVLADSADSSAYTKVYEASAVSDLSCDLRYEELVLKTWNED